MTAGISSIPEKPALIERRYSLVPPLFLIPSPAAVSDDKERGMAAVLIRGEGIAGTCCSRLLGDAGLQLTVEKLRRSKLPAVMLGDTAQKLLRDVFDRADLFEGLPQIRKRVVARSEEH